MRGRSCNACWRDWGRKVSSLPDLLKKAEDRGALDIALEVVAWFNQRDSEMGWHATTPKVRSPQGADTLGVRSTDAAAGFCCATYATPNQG